MKKNNKKGFTLAELLVVVAIIAVLTAIAIPVFSGATTKAKEAADIANLRAAYAQAVTNQLTSNTPYPTSYDSAKFGKLNRPANNICVWSNPVTGTAKGLHVKYVGTKAGTLSLVADPLS